MADAKKLVFKVDVHDETEKSKAMKAVAGFKGIESISVDIKDKKMTLIGIVDPIVVVFKLRKRWHAEIITVGPAKKEKKPEPKKPEPKKPDVKPVDPIAECIWHSRTQYPPMIFCAQSAEENPNTCIIL